MKGLYQKRGWWYYQAPTPKGGVRPKPVALKTEDEVAAITAVTEMQMTGMELAAEIKGTLAEILPIYYKAKGDDRKKTRQTRLFVLGAFQDVTGNPRLVDITRQTIMDWRERLATTGGTLTSSEGVSPTTLTSYLIIVRAFFNWCVKERLIRVNPARDMGRQSMVLKTRRQEFFPLAERDLMLERPRVNRAGNEVKPEGDYVGLMLHIGFFAGLRIGEMLAFKKEWLYISEDWSHGSISVQPTMIEFADKTKGEWRPKTENGIRTVPLHPRLLAFLKSYGLREPYMVAEWKPLFPNDDKKSLRFDPKRTLHTHGRLCGLAGVNYHKMRHSFGTHLAMGGMTAVEIAGLMGITVKVAMENYMGFAPRSSNPLPGL